MTAARTHTLTICPGLDVELSPPHSPTSLDPLETNRQRTPGEYLDDREWRSPFCDIRPVTHAESAFRHSGWAPKRQRTWNALVRLHERPNNLVRFANCGAGCYVQVRDDGQDIRLCSSHCHSRWCVPCANAKAQAILANLRQILAQKSCRFLTLTLRHNALSLRDQLKRLYACFSQLRHRLWWKKLVDGGAAFLEVKVSERDGHWHPHLHILVEGCFMPHRELSAEWYKVTGDSTIVHIEQIHDEDQAAVYVTKYVTKPADSSIYHHEEKLAEVIAAFRGTHTCLTFGSWRGLKLTEPSADEHQWRSICSFDELAQNLARNEPDAVRYFEALCRKYPCLALPHAEAPP